MTNERKQFEKFFKKFGIPHHYESDSDPTGFGKCSSIYVEDIEFYFNYPGEVFSGIEVRLSEFIDKKKVK